MSSTRRKTALVGLVTAVSLALTGLGIFLVGQEQNLWEGRTSYRIRFARADGLQQGAPVTLQGVNVGSVRKVSFPDDPLENYVEIEVAIITNVSARIRKDTIGRVQTLGLLGDKYIQLSPGSPDAPPLDAGGVLRSLDPVDYEALLDRSGDVVSNAIEVTALLREVLTAVNQGEGLVGRLLKDDALGKDSTDFFYETTASAAATAESVRLAAARLDSMLADVEAGEGAFGALLRDDSSVRRAMENLESATADAAALAAELRSGRGLLHRLATDEELASELAADLDATAENLAEISGQVASGRGSLGKLIYEEELYDGAQALVGDGEGGIWGLIGRFLWPFGGGDNEEVGSDGAGSASASPEAGGATAAPGLRTEPRHAPRRTFPSVREHTSGPPAVGQASRDDERDVGDEPVEAPVEAPVETVVD